MEIRRLAWLAAFASACKPVVQPCEDNAQCRDAFGFGQVCGQAGYCEPAAPSERCTRTWPEDLFLAPENYQDAFVLGSLYDRSLDVPEANSARLAFMQAAGQGGIDGRPVAMVECTYEVDAAIDSLDAGQAAAEVASYLVDDLGIVGMVGPNTSSEVEAVYLATEGDDVFIISPSASSPALTTIDGDLKSDDDPGVFWRTVPPDSLQGQVAATDLLARGRTDVAVIYAEDAYGIGLQEAFTASFEAEGGTVLLYGFSDAAPWPEHLSAIDELPLADATEVFFISSSTSEIASFLNSAADLDGFADRAIFLSDAAADADLFLALDEDVDALLDQIRGTRPSVPDNALYTTFRGLYVDAYPTEDPYASVYMPYAYDASWLLLYATAWAHFQEPAITGTAMGAGMRRVSSGEPIDLKTSAWSTGAGYFADGAAIDVSGASGDLDYDPLTEETKGPIDVWVIGDDEFVTEYTVAP